MESSNLELKSLIQGFILSCQTSGRSSRTVEWYDSFLVRFYHFLNSNGLPTSLDLIEKQHVRAFIHYLQTDAKTPYCGKTLSPFTIQGYVRSLKSFFSWLVREEYLKSNIMTSIPVPKAPSKIVNTFSSEQLKKLITICQASDNYSCRNLCIILFMLDSGIRVSELVNVNLGDVKMNEGFIKIRIAKGGKERLVPVGSVTLKVLWKYINQSRNKPLTDRIDRLFLNSNGLPLTKNGIQQMLRRLGKKAGISGVRCSPHTLRHTFAKNYLLNGGDIFSLQSILGHSSLASVRIYLNLFATDLKKQHQRFSPVDNMVENRSLYPLIRSAAGNSSPQKQ